MTYENIHLQPVPSISGIVSDVNKTTNLKTKTKTTESKTKTNTNAIAADNVIIIGKVAIIVSFLQHNILYVFTVFHYNFLCVVCI